MAKDIVIVLGVGLIILGIVGRVKTPHFEVGAKSPRKRMFLGIVGFAFMVTFFSGEINLHYRRYFPVTTTPVILIEPIETISLDSDAKYIKEKIYRNIAELLSNAGHRVIAPPLSVIVNSPTNFVEKKFSIQLIPDGDNLDIHVFLSTSDGSLLASTELTGSLSELRTMYKILPNAILYGLDVDERTLRLKNTAKLPTRSTEAYAHYLYACRKINSEDIKSAQTAMERAISLDDKFALAYWSLGVLMSEQGNAAEGQELIQEALQIDRDHDKIPFTSKSKKSDPVPSLMSAIKSIYGQVKELEPGLCYAKVVSRDYGIDIHIWTVDPTRFDIELMEQMGHYSSNISEFLESAKAILALNGGFFDIGDGHRLNSSGLLVVNGVIRNETPNRKSGAIVSDSNGIKIVWVKDLNLLSRYNFVLQAGPVLVEGRGEKGIRRNDCNRLNRSAVCMRGSTILFVVIHSPHGKGLSLYEFAEILVGREMDGGLGCDLALNLDGGPSTQFAMNHQKGREKVDGLWKIHNAIVVKKK